MSDRYMVATAIQGKVVDYSWCSNWSSSRLIMYSLWYAAKIKDCTTIEELYNRICVKESYEERKDVLDEVITWSEELIMIDLDSKNVYFGVDIAFPYVPERYKNWPIASFNWSPLLFNPQPYDHYGGSGLFKGQRVPFDSFNNELLISYCKEYKGWELSNVAPKNGDKD